MTSAAKGGSDLTFSYDALSRLLSETGPQGTVASDYDAAGRRTKLTYPGTGLYVNYDYLVTGEPSQVRENGAVTGTGVLASYAYDNRGNRTSITFGNGASESYGYDDLSRLTSLTLDLAGSASDLTKTFAYNPANQIVSETRSNDAYAQALSTGTQTTTTNGLNQLATVNGTSAGYDARGNMTSDPVTGKTYTYWPSNNQLWTVPSPFASHSYDALDRLWSVSNGGTVTNYVADGADIIAEHDASGALQKRYVFVPGIDEPLVQYDAASTRTWMLTDERGSVVALANDSGSMTAINTYDEYGVPGASNDGTFQYTGQMWMSRAGEYFYRNRMYAQHLGRFDQTDPMGQADDANLYAYVMDDPVNNVDPPGLAATCSQSSETEIDVCGTRRKKADPAPTFNNGPSGGEAPRTAQGGGAGRGSIIIRKRRQSRLSPQCQAALNEAGEIEANAAAYVAIVGGEAQDDCRIFTSLQVLRDGPERLIFLLASTQRKEVIRCLMVQQGGRKGVLVSSDR